MSHTKPVYINISNDALAIFTTDYIEIIPKDCIK